VAEEPAPADDGPTAADVAGDAAPLPEAAIAEHDAEAAEADGEQG
jgi:hypothetical protein